MADPVDPRAGLEGDWVIVGSGGASNAQAAPPPQPYEGTASMGRRSAALNNMSEADYAKYRESIWNTQLRPALSQIADPKTISDVAALLVPDAAGVRTAAAAAIRAGGRATELAGRGTELLGKGMEAVGANKQVQGVARWIGGGTAAHGNPIVGGITAGTPPALQYGGKGLQAVGRGLQTAGRAVGEELQGVMGQGATAAVEAAPLSAAELIKAGPPAGAANAMKALEGLVPGERLAVQRAWAEKVAAAGGPEKYFGTKVPSWKAGRTGPSTSPSGSTIPPPAAPVAEAAAPAVEAAAPYEVAIEKAKAASPRQVHPEPAAPGTVKPVVTIDQIQAVQKLEPFEQEQYLKLRAVGDTHAEAMQTVNHTRDVMRQRETAQSARAMLGSNTAASELFGNETKESLAKLAELTAGTGRTPHKMVNEAMAARLQWLYDNPKAAWLLPLLGGGTLGHLAARDKD